MLTALYIMLGLALMLGGLLGLSALLFKVERKPLVTRIDAILPQTQCRQCGYPGCKPYAIAIANGEADINQCPPGGDMGARALADLMGMEYKPLNPEYGVQKPKSVALIDEVTCIGCTLCIQACPVDAILGAAKHMHTIIAAECTGCELCLAPCPVDCITMVPVAETPDNWKWKYPVFPIKSDIPLVQYYRYAKSEIFSIDKAQEAADIARERHDFRLARIEKEKLERAQKLAERALANKAEVKEKSDAALDKPQSDDAKNKKATHQIDKKAAIAAAIARVKAQKLAAAEAGNLPKNTENLSVSIQSEIDEIEAMRGKANHMTEG